jgi:subfamily B ATP-binding cassette protein MsbA
MTGNRPVPEIIHNLMKNKTVLVIAHRLSTIENADIIYLVDEGKIVESGTHEDLLKNKYLYHRLHQVQLSQGEKGSA